MRGKKTLVTQSDSITASTLRPDRSKVSVIPPSLHTLVDCAFHCKGLFIRSIGSGTVARARIKMHRLAEFFRRNKSAINRAGRPAERTELHSPRPSPRGRWSERKGRWEGRAGQGGPVPFFAVVALDKNQARRKSGADRSDPRPRPRALETRSIFHIPASTQRKKEIYIYIYVCVCVCACAYTCIWIKSAATR